MAITDWLAKFFRKKTHLKPSAYDFNQVRKDYKSMSRQSLEEDFSKLKVAYDINRDVLAAGNLEDALNMLIDRIAEVMSVEIVSLMLVGKNTGELLLKFAKG